jgi:hypothetical protein
MNTPIKSLRLDLLDQWARDGKGREFKLQCTSDSVYLALHDGDSCVVSVGPLLDVDAMLASLAAKVAAATGGEP